MSQLFLLNHGEASIKPDTQNKDWPLSEQGALQAISISSTLAKLTCSYIYSSPYLRCRETVTPYAKTSSKLINIHQGLKDVHVSYEPLEHYDRELLHSWHDFDYCLPTGETCRAGQQRAISTLLDIAASHKGKKILVSTHQNFIGLVLNSIVPGFGFEEMQKIKEAQVIPVIANENGLSLGEIEQGGFEFDIPIPPLHGAESFTIFKD